MMLKSIDPKQNNTKMNARLKNRYSNYDAERESIWLVAYISLFTSLLAFFILSTTIIELEGSSVRRNYQQFQHALYLQVMAYKQRMKLDWLSVEESVTKGTRLTIRADKIKSEDIFRVGSDKLSTSWIGEMQDIALLLENLHLIELQQYYGRYISGIDNAGYQLHAQVLIEGHTDNRPMSGTRFPSNWELSTARALQVEQLLQAKTHLAPNLFAIAGLGSFRPAGDISDYANNRRVEIYINAQLRPKTEIP